MRRPPMFSLPRPNFLPARPMPPTWAVPPVPPAGQVPAGALGGGVGDGGGAGGCPLGGDGRRGRRGAAAAGEPDRDRAGRGADDELAAIERRVAHVRNDRRRDGRYPLPPRALRAPTR